MYGYSDLCIHMYKCIYLSIYIIIYIVVYIYNYIYMHMNNIANIELIYSLLCMEFIYHTVK